jgi:hypothetical protein
MKERKAATAKMTEVDLNREGNVVLFTWSNIEFTNLLGYNPPVSNKIAFPAFPAASFLHREWEIRYILEKEVHPIDFQVW